MFNHILREANDTADGLAKEGILCLNVIFDVWIYGMIVSS